MFCPKCKKEQHCPCVTCKKRHGQKITWIWKTGNGPIACGHCGYTMSEDHWLDEEFKQIKAMEAKKCFVPNVTDL